jgi:hypothetical protein
MHFGTAACSRSTLLATIGPQLKEARERRGMTAVEAARRLHMRAMFVEALEREHWGVIGEPVYIRGFLRNYARMVGLNGQALVDAFNDSEPVAAAPHQPALSYEFAAASRTRFRYPWLLATMSVVALVLVVRVIWTMAMPGALGHNEVRPPAAIAQTADLSGSRADDGANAAVSSAHRGVDLRLALTQPCWLSIVVDGKRVVYETLPAGTVKEFHGVREISLRAGNAGGVVATIDGQSIGTLGHPGQVQDRVFAVNVPAIGQTPLHE